MTSLQELQDIIQDKYGIGPDEIDPQEPLGDKGLDSLALAELLFEIEERLGISLPDPGPEVNTLAALAALVDRVRAQAAATSS